MSIITDFLKLFKYDPETDGASTFNIKQCLNDNWDKIDAWASGIKTTIAGLVPGTRKVNGKELSADVTLTGEDIKTSASDETTISSQLSKKAEWMPNNWKTEADAPSAYPLNSATTFFSGNSFAGIDQCIVTTYAYNLNAARQIVSFLDNTGVKYRLTIGEDQWGAWKQISTATPPQEFDLALYDGFTVNGRCFYYKTQESVVHVIGGVNGSFPYKLSTTIGQLPAGFRPSAATRGIAVTNNAPAYIQINTNGAVVLYEMGLDGTPAGTSAFFVLSFVAAD